jgi:WD40 repeat protein
MTGWKRVSENGAGRERQRSRPGPRSWPAILAVALILSGVGPVSGRDPTLATTGCEAGATGAAKTVDGLPRDTGEASGLATSISQPGVAWLVRDSGHPASLYALRIGPDGTVSSVREIPVEGADNHDWEDVTYFTGPDGSAHLWVVESGQGRSNRVIYDIPEPDANTATSVRPVARYTYSYPDANTNTEAAFTWDGRLVLVTKTFPARVYRFDAPLSTTGANEPVLLGELTDSNDVSVVKPSPDGRWIATATHDTVYLYRNATKPGALEGFLNQEPFHVLVAAPEDNVESGDFFPAGSCQLLLASEQRNTYRVTSG